MYLAQRPVMSVSHYRVLQVTSVLVLLAAEVILSLILVWLIRWHGVIACGKGLFDNPNWPASVIILVGVPGILVFGAGALFLWCSHRIVPARPVL